MVDELEQFQQDLLESVRQMKAGKAARVTQVPLSAAAEARAKVGVSQSAFAKLIGVSLRTLQDWEQGRRQPTGAAQTLLRVESQHPEALLICILLDTTKAFGLTSAIQNEALHFCRGFVLYGVSTKIVKNEFRLRLCHFLKNVVCPNSVSPRNGKRTRPLASSTPNTIAIAVSSHLEIP